jgi:hypothetical protein
MSTKLILATVLLGHANGFARRGAALRVPSRRCISPVALEPQLDGYAAFACMFSLSPVVLALHWGTEWNGARDRLARAQQSLRREKARLLCGDTNGCSIDYQNAETAFQEAQQDMQDFRNFRVAGATQQLFRQTSRPRGARRVPRAVMDASKDVETAEPDAAETVASLEEKMSKWEASDEELRSKTLGGNLPLGMPGRMTRKDQPTKMDGFDMGMALSAVILIPLTLAVLAFPFLIGGIDVNSVGLPPSV